MLYSEVRSKMYKLLFVFFMVISSPLYSDKLNYLYQKNEFTYQCDREGLTFSMIFKVETRDKTIVHSQSVFKTIGSVSVTDVNKQLDIYYWDEDNDSVWTTNYFYEKENPFLRTILFNFKKQKLVLQFLKNDVSKDGRLITEESELLNCYTLK